MNVLGFNYWGHKDAHDTSAAMVCDGVLVAAAEQERFSRIKHDGHCPFDAIDFCLRRAGLRMDQVDVIAFPEKPFRSGPDSPLADMDYGFLRRLQQRKRSIVHKWILDKSLRLGLRV